ncbi:MAG: carboxypeptidase-like regulatory domain-containing protein [Pyrinomonadaceae bacterium]|nr:carboxypeptidase-like regulatory domain-containing protein [Pyrinomonadaceae bacterium]
MRKIIKTILVFICMLSIILAVNAQIGIVYNSIAPNTLEGNNNLLPLERAIAGTVTDKHYKFIEKVRVRVINVKTKKQYLTRTNNSGFYKIKSLPLGTYFIKFERKGFLTKTIKNIEVGLNGGVIYNISLEIKLS